MLLTRQHPTLPRRARPSSPREVLIPPEPACSASTATIEPKSTSDRILRAVHLLGGRPRYGLDGMGGVAHAAFHDRGEPIEGVPLCRGGRWNWSPGGGECRAGGGAYDPEDRKSVV